jgi:hypothetical protein
MSALACEQQSSTTSGLFVTEEYIYFAWAACFIVAWAFLELSGRPLGQDCPLSDL